MFVITFGACGGSSGCNGCASEPLPGGKLPADQTVEGGGQIRVTQAGFTKLTSIVPGLLNQGFANGFCIPDGSALGVDYCYETQGQCAPGCKVNLTLNSTQISVTAAQTMNIKINLSAGTSVPVDFFISTCQMTITATAVTADLDIAFAIDPATGELRIRLDRINGTDLSGVAFTGCGVLSFVADLVVDVLDSFLGDFIIQLLTPTINNLIQSLLPNPLGIAGMTDLGQMLAGISPGTEGKMESRVVPGGFVTLNNGGMTLGLITGFNSDEDPTTRTAALDSEPALCVPPFKAPNFAAPPASLPITTRSTFTLVAANEFRGMPDPTATDIAMGFSETTLDLFGHHAVASGAMCLGIGTSFVQQLNVGTFGIFAPSLAELGSENGKDPVLLVIRPQKPMDFAIGDGTLASPSVTLGIKEMEVDVYAFLYERYVRAFTMQLTMNVGINLEFEQMPGQPARIKPTLVGLKKENVTLTVLNSEFVAETKAELEQKLPAIFDIITPLLGTLPAFDVPTFAGFKLENLRMKKVVTTEDEFVAIFANFGASTKLRQMGRDNPALGEAVTKLDMFNGDRPQPAARLRPTLTSVVTPSVTDIGAALATPGKGALPTVTLDAPAFDSAGRSMEYSWNLNGGMWRPFVAGGKMVIADKAFAMQGKYSIGLISRVKGDYRTSEEAGEINVVIDSVGPRFLTSQTAIVDDVMHVRGYDLVSQDAIKIAFGRPGDDAPATAWQTGAAASLSRAQLKDLLVNDELVAFLEDETGNLTVELFSLGNATGFHGQAGSNNGCSCDSSGVPSTGNLVLALLVGGMLLFGRRRHIQFGRVAKLLRPVVLLAGCVVVGSLVPACNCGSTSAQSCEVAADCAECPTGEIAFCIENTCLCSDDIVPGKIGLYSDVAAQVNGTMWVSGYSQTYGDLVMAQVTGPGRIPLASWEWVDGVPDGPIEVENSKVRRGISAPGVDVGMYTSVQIANNGTPMVSYFDRDSGSLKFAAKVGDVWQIHVVDMGTGPLTEIAGVNAGMYTSMALRSDDGRPGIAYLAHKLDGAGERAEVRFAAAQVAVPTSAADWQTFVVDSAPIPLADPQNPDVYPLPAGLGLFVDMARQPNQAPVVVYYDRGNGDLKMSKFNPGTGKFDAPVVLDGAGDGNDAGWSPSVAVDAAGGVKIAYVSARKDDLMFYDVKAGATPEVIDNGYRIVGMTSDGLPKPEFHFVGDDASLIIAPNVGPTVVYQDATSHELLVSQKAADNVWRRAAIAGADNPFVGAYGFFASAAIGGNNLVVSSWVVDQTADENWVEVFVRPLIVD
ncbi:MAG: hypothetical protein KBG15_07540 [Kofleriaceae bacterium]|nr:hypothetical protein [Kofleriaceae bacterium]